MPPQIPSVGRIVHYVSYGTPGGEYPSVCRAAIVTAVDDDYQEQKDGPIRAGHVGLCVLNPEGMFFNQGVTQDEDAKSGGTPGTGRSGCDVSATGVPTATRAAGCPHCPDGHRDPA